MKILLTSIAVVGLVAGLANAQDDWIGFGVADGAVTITNATGNVVPMLGLDVKSADGGLKANGAGPFTITLLDSPGNVVVGNLGTAYELAGNATVATDIAYSGGATDIAANFAGTTWGNGTTPTPVAFPTGPVTPEPASGLMAVLGLLGILGFRRRR